MTNVFCLTKITWRQLLGDKRIMPRSSSIVSRRRRARERQTSPGIALRTPHFSSDEAAIKILFTTGIKPNTSPPFLASVAPRFAERRIKSSGEEKKNMGTRKASLTARVFAHRNANGHARHRMKWNEMRRRWDRTKRDEMKRNEAGTTKLAGRERKDET